MKWLALVLLFFQAKRLSSCTFDKMESENITGVRQVNYTQQPDINGCFAACYANPRCIGIQYREDDGDCQQYGVGNSQRDCISKHCYHLKRDEVASVCNKYVNV